MKKAYVKPIFFAEEFEGTSNVAVCHYKADEKPLHVWDGKGLCYVGDGGHHIGKKEASVDAWWDYATNTSGADAAPPSSESLTGFNDAAYLFTDNHTICDFVWNGPSTDVGIWTSEANNADKAISNSSNRTGTLGENLFVTLISGFNTFFGIEPDNDQHVPGLKGQVFFS